VIFRDIHIPESLRSVIFRGIRTSESCLVLKPRRNVHWAVRAESLYIILCILDRASL